MNITKDTKLKDILMEYPWIKDEIIKINDKFKMLNTPIGKVMWFWLSVRSGKNLYAHKP